MNWEDIIKSNIKDMVMDAFVGKYGGGPRVTSELIEDDLGYVPLSRKQVTEKINQVTTGFGTTEVSGYIFSFVQLRGRRLTPYSGTLTITDKSNGKKLVAQRKHYEKPELDFYDYDSSEG
tara:strand:- start:127 stop:486 length:360 start_codon:yes stop_codon:yes gene_type:complete